MATATVRSIFHFAQFIMLWMVLLHITAAASAAPGDFGGVTIPNSLYGGFAMQPDGTFVVGANLFEKNSPNSTTYAGAFVFRYKADKSRDLTFGSGGQIAISILNFNHIDALALQPDGKLIVLGYGYPPGIEEYFLVRYFLARFNSDGSLDPTFGSGGSITIQGEGGSEAGGISGDLILRDLVVQPDNKLVVGGATYESNGDTRFVLLRFNPDGSPDSNFGAYGKATTNVLDNFWGSEFTTLAIQPDGKLLVTGWVAVEHVWNRNFTLIRFDTNGNMEVPSPSNPPIIQSISPTYGPKEGNTIVTVTGSRFTNATLLTLDPNGGGYCGTSCVSMRACGPNDPLYGIVRDDANGNTEARCFTIFDDNRIGFMTKYREVPGSYHINVINADAISAVSNADVFTFEGWDDSVTPPDKTAFDVPVGKPPAQLIVRAAEQGVITIGHSALPDFVTCDESLNSVSAVAQITCTVAPKTKGLTLIKFFDASGSEHFPPRYYIIGRGKYVAMGDSYSAGEGVVPFISTSLEDTGADGCHRSAQAYGPTIMGKLYGDSYPFEDFRACSGAKIQSVLFGGKGENSQVHQLDATTDLVTVSVGGNDVGFSRIGADCVFHHIWSGGGNFGLPKECQYVEQNLAYKEMARIGSFEPRVEDLWDGGNVGNLTKAENDPIFTLYNFYTTIRKYAPNARIIVMGYPRLLPKSSWWVNFSPVPLDDPYLGLLECHFLTPDEHAWLNQFTKDLDDTIERSAAMANVEYVRDVFDSFDGHERCPLDPSSEPWAFGAVPPPDNVFSFHPNDKGQQKFADLVLQKIESGPPGSTYLIHPNEAIVVIPPVIDPNTGQVTFGATWPGSDIVMTLVSPSGVRITRSTTGTNVFHSQGSTYESFTIFNPEPGRWKVELFGANISADGEIVRFTVNAFEAKNQPPFAEVRTHKVEGTAKSPVNFDASTSYDPDGQVVSYAWDFDDGNISTDSSPTHIFEKPGTYFVRLAVTDNGGRLGYNYVEVLIREPTALVYYGPQQTIYSNTFNVSATFTSSLSSQPITGATITFNLGTNGSSCTAVTNASGIASCMLTANLAAGASTITVQYAKTDQYADAQVTVPFTIAPANSTLTFTAPTGVVQGSSITLSSTLSTGATPIIGRNVSFTLGSQTCSAMTNATGFASCSITISQSTGPTNVAATFTGDGYYRNASANGWTFIRSVNALPAPSGVTTRVAHGSIRLSWSAVQSSTLGAYYVYRYTDQPGNATKVGQVSGSPPAAAFTDTNVVIGTTYSYWVTSVDKSGNQSDISKVMSAVAQ